MGLMFVFANMNNADRSQLASSHQKDTHYRTYLKSLLRDFLNNLPGMKLWLKWNKEIDLGADLLYYGLTTLAGYQTLGEEYASILPINHDRKDVPSKYILVPYLLDKLASSMAHRLKTDGTILGLKKRTLADVVVLSKNFTSFLHKYHLALFYTGDAFYSLSKRVLGIYYTQVQPYRRNELSRSYHFLGLMMLIQLSITFVHRFYKVLSSMQDNEQDQFSLWQLARNFLLYSNESEEEIILTTKANPELKCPPQHVHHDSNQDCCLCQRKIIDICCTPCGHIFCWKCVLRWCQTQQNCPMCKEVIIPSKLVKLQNFT